MPKDGGAPLTLASGQVLEAIKHATSSVDAFLDPSVISRLENDLTLLSRGHDLVGKDNPGTCLGSP
jgi:hypothetical protein